MSQEDIYSYLDSHNLWYEKVMHKAVYNMDELSEIYIPYPDGDAKNLFLRDEKKEHYYLITIKGDKKLDLKEFKNKYNTKRLTFAKEEELESLLSLSKGAVTPFGLLNDENRTVEFYIDNYFYDDEKIIGIHPNVNTSTVWMYSKDLINIIKEHGNIVNIVDM